MNEGPVATEDGLTAITEDSLFAVVTEDYNPTPPTPSGTEYITFARRKGRR